VTLRETFSNWIAVSNSVQCAQSTLGTAATPCERDEETPMKLLETTAATIEFEIVENAGRDTDPRLDTLRRALHEARNEIMVLRAEVDKLSGPPSTYGVYLSAHDDDTVDILAQ
jgi:hypothetical protein